MHDLQTLGYRRVVPDDLPWLLSLGYRRYGPYDPGRTLAYLLDAMRNPNGLFIRADRAFCLSALIMPVWSSTELECHVIALCADTGGVWEAAKLLRESVTWAKVHKCRKWRFGSETNFDVGPLARWLGAVEEQPRFRIDL
jgi:hypothetical protein